MNHYYHLYVLVLELPTGENIKVGKKGEFYFPPGYYVYVGSAKKNIEARVARHIQKKKKKRWHIDYLTTLATPVVLKLLCGEDLKEYSKFFNYEFEVGLKDECKLAAFLADNMKGKVIVRGFGATDCGCKSHLYYFNYKPFL